MPTSVCLLDNEFHLYHYLQKNMKYFLLIIINVCMLVPSITMGQTADEEFFIDFGPDDATNGNKTSNPDANALYWNNFIQVSSGSKVDLINTANESTPYSLSVRSDFFSNGIQSGGLLAPEASKLEELAVATATQDYFFTTTSASLAFENLDEGKVYRFSIFGSRNVEEIRTSGLSLTGATSSTGQYQTSGTDLGGTGYHGNNSSLYVSNFITPDNTGQIELELSVVAGGFAYINLMKIEAFPSSELIPTTSLEISVDDISESGATVVVAAEFTPSDATNKHVTWAVSDASIAHISKEGIITPKRNGTVSITGTTQGADGLITATTELSISNQINSLYLAGSATENEATLAEAIPMRMITSLDSTVTNKFEVYTQLSNSGTFKFYTSTSDGEGLIFGGGDGTLEENGSGITHSEEEQVRIEVDLSNNSYQITPISKWSVVGSLVENGWEGRSPLAYAGNGIWTGSIDLSNSANGVFSFAANDDWDYHFKSLVGYTPYLKLYSEAIAQGEEVQDIPMKAGVYNITLDLKNYSYAIVCSETIDKKITFFGSSVCKGQGATDFEGYAFHFEKLLDERADNGEGYNWEVSNISIPGDNTLRLMSRWETDLIPECAEYVVYGLSLGNEGIREKGHEAFDQWRDNMQTVITEAKAKGMKPVVMNNYTRADFTPTDYEFIKAMNLLIHEWNVPSINLLGAIDDEQGHWAAGHMADGWHPNDAGHEEFFYAMNPSLFDAMEDDIAMPEWIVSEGLKIGATEQLTVDAKETMHAFTVSVDIKTTSTGEFYEISSSSGDAQIRISSSNGTLIYDSKSGEKIIGNVAVNDDFWHRITLTHYFAHGETLLYADNELMGRISEKFAPTKFTLIGQSDLSAKNLLLYRAAINEDEVAALNDERMLKSSLEVYAPLDGTKEEMDERIQNIAQSKSTIQHQAVTGILDRKPINYFIYPNPLQESSKLYYRLTKAEKISIQLMDLNGKLISMLVDQVQSRGSYQHDLYSIFKHSKAEPGIYICKADSESYSFIQKIILE